MAKLIQFHLVTTENFTLTEVKFILCVIMPLSLDNDIIPYTSTFIRLSHLYQEFCAHCTVIVNE